MWDFQKSAWIIWTSYNHQCYSFIYISTRGHSAWSSVPRSSGVSRAAQGRCCWKSPHLMEWEALKGANSSVHPSYRQLGEVGPWRMWQCLGSEQPAVTEHRLGGLQTTDIDFWSSGGRTPRSRLHLEPRGLSCQPSGVRLESPGPSTQPRSATEHRFSIWTQISVRTQNTDSVSERKNLMSPRLIHPEVKWKRHSITYSPKIDFRLPRVHESK